MLKISAKKNNIATTNEADLLFNLTFIDSNGALNELLMPPTDIEATILPEWKTLSFRPTRNKKS
tara:strand:- start:58 stop:249 length:192 start_codon:yes stop_codon:yes gene_type:complete